MAALHNLYKKETEMKKAIAVALLSIASAPAFADSGLYIGGTLGRASTSNFGSPLTSSSASVYGGLVGYQINQNFGVEAQYTGAGKFSTATMSGKSDILTIDAVGSMPVSDSFSIYGKIGMGSSKTKVSDATATYQNASRTALTYGLGVQYAATPNVGIRFGWDRYGSAVSNAGVKTNINSNVLAAGVVYGF
jgi:OOP family OmpA-OmpF porin